MGKEKTNKVYEILSSLDGIQRIQAPVFFYTRLREKMEKGRRESKKHKWILQPVFVAPVLLFFLIINITAIIWYNHDRTNSTSKETETLQNIASGYNLINNSLYDINE